MEPNIVLDRRGIRVNRRRLKDFATRACRAAGLTGGVTVMLTSNREMRTLNLRFRGKDRATDVLSFPAPPSASGFAGDIAISLEIAAKNARQLGHSTARELEVLALHGILHLAGYDHENDRGEMAQKERALQKKLALAGGVIDRSSGRPKTKRKLRA
jgi:probable rRNA maturation factor